MPDKEIRLLQAPEDRERAAASIKDVTVLSSGRSAPGLFKNQVFDFNLVRFLSLTGSGCAEIGECLSTAHLIEDGNFESWTSEWHALAERIEKRAQNALARNHRVSARGAFLRAMSYYQAALFLLPDSDPRKRPYYRKHVQCFEAAGALFDGPFETVNIPYGERTLPAFFLRPDDSGAPRPTVFIQNGGDGTAAQIYGLGGGAGALRRGYNVLLFDGPGQTGAYLTDSALVYRYDWEVPVTAIVDYLVGRTEVDAHRIALIAYSMGGYFGPRAAAFEKRIAALVADPLIPEMYTSMIRSMELGDLLSASAPDPANINPRQRYALEEFMPRWGFKNGLSDLKEWVELLKKMNLEGLGEKLSCPVLNLSSTGEGKTIHDNALAFFNKLTNPKNQFVITSDDDGAEIHCQLSNVSLLSQLIFDWLDDIFEN